MADDDTTPDRALDRSTWPQPRPRGRRRGRRGRGCAGAPAHAALPRGTRIPPLPAAAARAAGRMARGAAARGASASLKQLLEQPADARENAASLQPAGAIGRRVGTGCRGRRVCRPGVRRSGTRGGRSCRCPRRATQRTANPLAAAAAITRARRPLARDAASATYICVRARPRRARVPAEIARPPARVHPPHQRGRARGGRAPGVVRSSAPVATSQTSHRGRSAASRGASSTSAPTPGRVVLRAGRGRHGVRMGHHDPEAVAGLRSTPITLRDRRGPAPGAVAGLRPPPRS